MTYLSDNPWPLIIVLGAIAVCCFLAGAKAGRIAGLVCIALAVGVYFLEQAWISPAETVEVVITDMLEDFKAEKEADIHAAIAEESSDLRAIATQGLNMVDLSEDFRVKSVSIEMNSDTQATARVRANGHAQLKSGGGGGQHMPTFWETVWNKQGEDWKLSKVTRLNPANGDPMGTFE